MICFQLYEQLWRSYDGKTSIMLLHESNFILGTNLTWKYSHRNFKSTSEVSYKI